VPCNRPRFSLDPATDAGFAARLQWAAGQNPALVCTSWGRTPEENAAVGGDPFSQHLVGWGVDVVGPDSSVFAKRARIAGLTTVQESDHLHVQAFPAGILKRLLSPAVFRF
jgi:hypothetical protein